jgi:hypothetical protein
LLLWRIFWIEKMTLKIIPDWDTGYIPSNEYSAKIRCINCGEEYYIAVEKGYTVKQSILTERCPNCDCRGTLRSMV